VQLAAREGRLSETFTFECLPSSGMLDSVLVNFSEPIGDAIEWSLLQPAAAAIGARRLDPADTMRNEVAREDGIAESWLIELRPAVPGPVTIRAVRAAPFDEAVPVPLAWVEGAAVPNGTVLVRGGGGPRPTVVNRRLRELPPAAGSVEEADATVAEFAYGDPRSMAAGTDPAAEIAPGAAESRAWAWRESITSWCHDSGRTESETVFELENHGRESLTLTVPGGLTLDGVSIDGLTAPLDGIGPAGGEIRLALPPGLRRTRLVVRGTANADSRLGVWRVAASGCAIDVPVLARQTRVMLPPELELALPADAADGSTGDWAFAQAVSPGLRNARASASGNCSSTRCIARPIRASWWCAAGWSRRWRSSLGWRRRPEDSPWPAGGSARASAPASWRRSQHCGCQDHSMSSSGLPGGDCWQPRSWRAGGGRAVRPPHYAWRSRPRSSLRA
jgi:hypothetical protein